AQGRGTAHGTVWALDVRTGKIVGKTTYPVPNQSGMLSTDGDLVFTGHSTGRFSAYDADTVKELWNYSLGTPITAPPMTFAVGGKQYIAVVAAGAAGLRGAVLYQHPDFVRLSGLRECGVARLSTRLWGSRARRGTQQSIPFGWWLSVTRLLCGAPE